jgi:hypothetical protein
VQLVGSFPQNQMLKVPMNLFKTLTLTVGALLLCGTAAQAAPVSGQGTWETTLQARDLDGDGVTDAFYDTELNVTWQRDGYASGLLNWNTARSWASSLVVGGYGGWRLPFVVDTGAPGCDSSNAGGTDCGFNVQTKSGSTVYSELAHLFHVTLGNKSYCAPGVVFCSGEQPGSGLSNSANFLNLQPYVYHAGTEYALDASSSWTFGFQYGFQGHGYKITDWYAIAVRPGDVTAAIPEPETYALMLAGLTALVVMRRCRTQTASTR